MKSLIASLGALKSRIRTPTGQIQPGSGVGQWIRLLCADPDVHEVVEIGTWRGNGSTRCIALGFAERARQDASAVCVEANQEMAREAERRHRGNGAVAVVWGRLIGEADLYLDELEGPERAWADQDKSDLQAAPDVMDRIPSEIDVLILDGGEFSTYPEFHLLQGRVRSWIVLDDTHTRKCRRIVEELRADSTSPWISVWSSDERNGVLVLRRDPRSGPPSP